jgi:RNA methyltransferase, TrmH family
MTPELSASRTRLLGRLRRRRARVREGLVLAEGLRVAREALDCGASVRFAVASPRALELGAEDILHALRGSGVEVIELDDRELAALADTDAPQGLLLVCREPRPDPDSVLEGDRLLLLDGLQDPGNVGTLVRSAAAFGLEGVVALDGTTDPWGAKAVRASAGAAFRVPLLTAPWAAVAAAVSTPRRPLLIADAAGAPMAAPPGRWTLVVGGEGAGVRPEVRERAGRAVAIPMPGGTESLNAGVAGSILMYALTRPGSRS